jgi:hypothetical protein
MRNAEFYPDFKNVKINLKNHQKVKENGLFATSTFFCPIKPYHEAILTYLTSHYAINKKQSASL